MDPKKEGIKWRSPTTRILCFSCKNSLCPHIAVTLDPAYQIHIAAVLGKSLGNYKPIFCMPHCQSIESLAMGSVCTVDFVADPFEHVKTSY
jgi:hypothetical protein